MKNNKSKIILNPFWSFIVLPKIIIMVMTLYIFSQHCQGWLLTVTGLFGILWIMEGALNEWNMYVIKETLSVHKSNTQINPTKSTQNQNSQIN